jgi:hypothetical protein
MSFPTAFPIVPAEERTQERYFYNEFLTYGKYQFPYVRKQEVNLTNLRLIRFSDTAPKEKEATSATVHFFEFDYRFDEVFKYPERYVKRLAQYRQVFSPDFSMYLDMSQALQIYNAFRNRWCAAFWQSQGLTVIPTIGWADKHTLEWSFDAIEQGCTVAISTIGCADAKRIFMNGYKRMLEVIKPEHVICYAKPFPEMLEMADVIEVPYLANARIAAAKER